MAVLPMQQGKQDMEELHATSAHSSTCHDAAVEQQNGLGSSNLLRLVVDISGMLQKVVSQPNQRILQPLCQRSIEETLCLLVRVKKGCGA